MLLIETPRLAIRNFRSVDAAALRQIIMQYAASPNGKYDYPWPTSEQGIQDAVTWFAGGDQFLAVCLKATGQLIGLVSLSKSEDPAAREYNLGYVFHADYHGQGYAGEACQALVSHAFTTWQAARLVSGTAAVNEASRRLLARLGFHKIGEGLMHFQTAPDGTPYEFLGYEFELTREAWESVQKR